MTDNKSAEEIFQTGVVYTISSQYLFIPTRRFATGAISPGDKFLFLPAPNGPGARLDGAAFYMVNEPYGKSAHFYVDRKYWDRIVPTTEEK